MGERGGERREERGRKRWREGERNVLASRVRPEISCIDLAVHCL